MHLGSMAQPHPVCMVLCRQVEAASAALAAQQRAAAEAESRLQERLAEAEAAAAAAAAGQRAAAARCSAAEGAAGQASMRFCRLLILLNSLTLKVPPPLPLNPLQHTLTCSTYTPAVALVWEPADLACVRNKEASELLHRPHAQARAEAAASARQAADARRQLEAEQRRCTTYQLTQTPKDIQHCASLACRSLVANTRVQGPAGLAQYSISLCKRSANGRLAAY
jgi:hypothetical protein